MKLMTHLYYGDPTEEFSQKLATTLIESGADILEIGIPYTDLVCDGEVFQRACKRALENGVTPFKVLEGIKKLRRSGVENPIYLTSYYAPIFKIGIEKFLGLAKETGVNGLIVPDILFEEQKELKKTCDRYGLSLIQFATVYSSQARLAKITKYSDDFIYCISLPGVTGETVRPLNCRQTQSDMPYKHTGSVRSTLPVWRNKCSTSKYRCLYGYSHTEVDIGRLIKNLKKITDRKILVGFGIKSREDASKIIKMGANGVIVGSAIARIYEKYLDNPEKSLSEISYFVKRLKEGIPIIL